MLWTHYKDSNNEYAIKVKVSIHNTIKYYPIGVSVLKTEWNGSRVKPNRENCNEINNKIVEIESKIEKELIKNPCANIQKLIDGQEANQDFYFYFQDYLDFVKEKYSYDYYCMYQSMFNKLKKFKPKLLISELNYDFMRLYERHLIGIGNHQNTIHNNFKRIGAVIKEMIKGKHIAYSDNPFLEFKVSKKKTKKDRLIYDDILKLSSQKGLAVDLFMFSFYCAGIRISDMFRLKHSNIKDGRLKYTMHKTDVNRDIKLPKQAIEILKRYKPNKHSPFVFGILESGLDEVKESIMIKSRQSKYRKQLKLACRKAKVKEISFHTSRHSVSDLAKIKGADIHTIKELLGHKKTETTEIYMRELYQEQTDVAMENLFG